MKNAKDDRLLIVLRQVGNYGLIGVAMVGLFINMKLGLVLNLCLSTLCIPYYARAKLWDTVFFIGFMFSVNLFGLLSGVPGCQSR